MMICILSIVQAEHMGGRPKKEIQWAQEFVELEKKIAALLEYKKDLLVKTDAHDKSTKDLSDLEARLADAEKYLREATNADQVSKDLEKQRLAFATNLEKLSAGKTPILAEIEALKKGIASRTKLPEELAAPLIIQADNRGLMQDLPTPYFIEVSSATLQLHQSLTAKVKIDINAMETDPAYAAFLAKAAADPKGLVLFLIREDGWETYIRAAYWAETHFTIKKGKIPLVGKGAVDLGKFEKSFKR